MRLPCSIARCDFATVEQLYSSRARSPASRDTLAISPPDYWQPSTCRRQLEGLRAWVPPPDTMLGALCYYVTHTDPKRFQPMKANLGILPPLETRIKDKAARKKAYAVRAADSHDGVRLSEMQDDVIMPRVKIHRARDTMTNIPIDKRSGIGARLPGWHRPCTMSAPCFQSMILWMSSPSWPRQPASKWSAAPGKSCGQVNPKLPDRLRQTPGNC